MDEIKEEKIGFCKIRLTHKFTGISVEGNTMSRKQLIEKLFSLLREIL